MSATILINNYLHLQVEELIDNSRNFKKDSPLRLSLHRINIQTTRISRLNQDSAFFVSKVLEVSNNFNTIYKLYS